MAHEFKPGDLALVIAAGVPENVGKVVTLIRRDCSAVVRIPENDMVWLNPGRAPAWVVSGELIGSKYGKSKVGAFLESRLMPLKGDEQPAQVRQVECVQ